MTTQAPLVTFSGVQKTYDGEHLVVRDLHLDIEAGEFLSLLGPSGSPRLRVRRLKIHALGLVARVRVEENTDSGENSISGKPISPWTQTLFDLSPGAA